MEDLKLSGDEGHSDAGESPVTVPKKGGRGRPAGGAKTKVSSDNEKVVEAKERGGRRSVGSKNKIPEITASGKGRGRPKKMQKLDDEEDVENGDNDEVDEDNEEVGDEEPEAVVAKQTTKPTKKATGKGRGRPKATKNSDDESKLKFDDFEVM